MKLIIILSSIFLSFTLFAEANDYLLRIKYYMAFSGAGPKMRSEEVVTMMDQKETRVAWKVYVDATNELREICYYNPEDELDCVDKKDPKSWGPVEKIFKKAVR